MADTVRLLLPDTVRLLPDTVRCPHMTYTVRRLQLSDTVRPTPPQPAQTLVVDCLLSEILRIYVQVILMRFKLIISNLFLAVLKSLRLFFFSLEL